MSKFKVGDMVTAGENYKGEWKDLQVVEIDSTYISAKRLLDGVAGRFTVDELTFTEYKFQDVSDQQLANRLRSLDNECVAMGRELANRGYIIDDTGFDDITWYDITRIYKIVNEEVDI